MRRLLLTLLLVGLLLVTMVAPALAIVHGNTPSNECGASDNAGGRRAAQVIRTHNPVFDPPVGRADAPTPAACQ